MFNNFVISREEKPLYIRSLSQTEDFYISFIHSVNKAPVKEFYKINGSKFILYKTEFQQYGAGMPETGGEFFRLDNGEIVITDIDTELDDFSVFVGTIAQHTAVFYNEEIPLSRLAPPMSSLKFDIKALSLFELLKFSLKQVK